MHVCLWGRLWGFVGQHATQVLELGAGEGGWRKIYLLLSENFDPRVVNLSKESSQLNRKHEEERKGGEAGMFGVFFRSEDQGWVVTILKPIL